MDDIVPIGIVAMDDIIVPAKEPCPLKKGIIHDMKCCLVLKGIYL